LGPLRDVLERLAAKMPRVRQAAVEEAWLAAVGDLVARKGVVKGLAGKTLLIDVPDAGWAAQLRALAPAALPRLQAQGLDITEILVRVRVAGSPGRSG
jgi:predicted nucleic acid-binding Zn ribbon protein